MALCLVTATALIVTRHYDSQFKVVYSLDKRQNDQEIVRLVNSADKYVYFAIYFFTKDDIADALIRAKKRGLDVQGITDAAASRDSNKDIVGRLRSAGIVVETQKHQDGIMHMKVLVTDKAYASGSYNWTASATEANDEILEIGTNGSLRKRYLDIIKRILSANGASVIASGAAGVSGGRADLSDEIPEYDYTEALAHIGERAAVNGTVLKVFTSKSGTTFLDFCEGFSDCPFSAVIFASDAKKFPDVSKLKRKAKITGVIRSYQGKAEIILSDPEQLN
jgi:hypothetical protein